MTQPPTGDPLADEAAELSRQVGNLGDAVVALRKSQRRTKTTVRLLAVVLALVVLLGVGLALVAVDARQASTRAEHATSVANHNADTLRLTCEIGNESRATQRQLWTYVLDVSTQGQTLNPAQRRQVMQFRAYVARTFAPRDCDSATPTVLPPTSTPTR